MVWKSARAWQPAIEEHRRRGHDDAAVDIVLVLIDRGIADPYRSVAAITGKRGSRPLLERVGVHDAIERPHLSVTTRGNTQDVEDKILHRACRTDTVERSHDEKCIAHPAKSIVPIASRARPFRN
jgi:hypothetical protein